ncbi:MAG: hypothetical protein RL499_879, partial [Actinomycetota bacterium]
MAVVALIGSLFAPLSQATPAQAATDSLSISVLEWSLMGLDSNDVTTGPDQFPIGATVCNITSTAVSNVSVNWVWDATNTFVNLDGGATKTIANLAANSCQEVRYTVKITRDTAAWLTSRAFRITASAPDVNLVSTPTGRYIFVDKIQSQSRNNSTLTGPSTVTVGDIVTYTLTGGTATQGYSLLMAGPTLDGSLFDVISVQATYIKPNNPTNRTVYFADGCAWQAPALPSASRGDCTLPNNQHVNFGGNTISVTVQARVIGTGTGEIQGLIFDLSGASSHYNSDLPIITVTSSDPTGSFSVQKLVTDPSNAVPDGEVFTVRYSVNGGVSTAVNLVAGATPTVISGIPTGSTVTFTEDAPSFSGVNWGTPVFNPVSASITIGNGTTVPVTVSNPFTLQTGSFSLQKFVTDPGNVVPDATPFTVRYSVNGGASTAVQLIAGEPATVISGIPTGATVTFTEDAPSFGGVNWGTPIFNNSSITIGNGTTVPVTVSNPFTLQTGSFSLQKSVTDPTNAVPDGTEFTVNYSVNGGASTPVTLVAGAAPTVISGLPTGATVTFTEDTPSFGGVNWGTPVFNPPSASITIGNGTTVPVTVSNPFTLQTGSFSLQKLITDPTDAVPDGTTFTVNYSVNGGPSVAVNLVAGAAATVISGIPTGATVTFTEDAPSFGGVNWGTPVFNPVSASITIGNGTTVPVTVSNPFTLQTGSFSLQKFVTDPTNAVPDGEEFTVRYSVNGGASTAVTLVAGAAPTVISGLPTGATVTFTEDAPSFGGVNWGTPVFNPVSASITIGNGTTVPVTVSNPFTLQTGSFSLQKLITDPTNAVPDATEFTVNYSVNGGPSVPVTLVAGAAATVISGIPTGATVTFTEDAPSFGGVNWGTPVFNPPSASITIGNGTTVPVTVTNPFTIKTGTFSLQKLLSGSGASLVPDGTIFEVEYSTTGLTGPWTTV